MKVKLAHDLMLTISIWLTLGIFFHPVQFVIGLINSFFPLSEGSDNYYSAAFIIGTLIIIAIYLITEKISRKSFE